MQRRYCLAAAGRTGAFATLVSAMCIAALMPVTPAHAEGTPAERANDTARRVQSSYAKAGRSSDYQPVFGLNYVRRGDAADCQVPLPPVGAISPFPISLRLGAMLSPRTAFDGGIDATIPGVHLLPGFSTRIDADAIISANFHNINTLVPVTFDQIYNLNLPVSTKVYVGGGIGPYFSNTTRFGGKLLVGAQFSRIGLEGDIHFAGIGDPLFTLQARLGL